MKERIIKKTNPKCWKKSSKIMLIIVLIVLVGGFVLSSWKPTKEKMVEQASENIQELIKKEENNARKHVTVTYNSLIVISYCSFSTSGANQTIERFVGFAGKVYKADKGTVKIVGQMVNYTYRMLGCGQSIMHGAKLTILLTMLTTIIGIFLGIILALGKISKKKWVSRISNAYIFFFRGTPLLIQLFVVYFSIPSIFGFAWRNLFSSGDKGAVYNGAFLAALIAFGLNAGAYCAEIVRAAIQSIDKGQYEAAKALGMTYGKTMKLVIIPQSVRRMIPPVCNEFITILKDASLVFAISLMDITTISKNIMTSEGSYMVFVPALIIYLIITAFFTFIFNKIEKVFSLYE